MIKTVLFDMNETLLDLTPLKEAFGRYFQDKHVVKYWFSKLLHSSTVIGGLNDYVDFGKLSEAALESVFIENDKELTEDIKTDILGTFKHLPAYDDVFEALERLKEAEIKIIPVTNSSNEMLEAQLAHSGLKDLVDTYYSVDAVERFKPFKNMYQFVLEKEALEADETVLVATHDWDLYGAKKEGLVTAYIKRKKDQYNPYYLKPDLKETHLGLLVERIIQYK